MPEATISQLARWSNFYVIVGSSAGALTGLQFVVITLVAQARAARSMHEIRAFGTPTIVHFFAALLISAVMSAPWEALSDVANCFAVLGAIGLGYLLMVIRHTRKQTGYLPDTADWFWYIVLPLAAYAILAAAAVLLWWRPSPCLFAIGGTTLLLLVIGIHNAWDSITYIALQRSNKHRER
jgi:hypothetical protein